MASILRCRQWCVGRVLPNAGSGRYIPKNHPSRAPIKTALYHYLTTTSQNPPNGWIYVGSGGLILRVSEVDAAGQNHNDGIDTLKAGDQITIGAQTATLVNSPIQSGPNVWSISVNAWPVMANGDYAVTITRA